MTAVSFACSEVEGALLLGIVDLDQRGGGAGLFEGFGDDDGDRLMVVLDLVAAEELGGVELALLAFADVRASVTTASTPGAFLRRRDVHAI